MKCPVCGSAKKKVVRERIRYDVRRNVYACKTCGMVYLEGAPKASATHYYASKEYRAKYGPTPGMAVDARNIFETYLPFQEPILERLKPILKPSMNVLDVGCSTGHFLHALKGKVKGRVGLELGRDEVAFIRKNLGITVYDQPIEETAITEGPFDLITCFQVLEHIEKPKEFVHALLKNLKPGGYLYIEVPNLDDVLLSQCAIPAYADFYFREVHVSYFTVKTLKKLLSSCGMQGSFGTVQRYTLFNHMHWLLTGKPQSDFALGNRVPVVAAKKTRRDAALNAWMRDTDRAYRTLIEKLGLGESVTFLGRKRK